MRYIRHVLHPIEAAGVVRKNIRRWRDMKPLRQAGVILGRNLLVQGRPKIVRMSGTIRIGDNVTLRSDDCGNHTSIYAPTRLMTDTLEDALIEIGDGTRINGACIHAARRITIGRNCLIASNMTMLDSDGHGVTPEDRQAANPVSLPVEIGDNVWIGMNSIILKGVRVGDGAVIGAGSVVTKDVPANCVAAGNPARVVKAVESVSSCEFVVSG